ncbi:hypothetical protein ES706_05597 [subsurface metagenome]
MNHLALRIWLMVSITPALGAVVIRLVWELTIATAVGTWVIIILLILVTLGIYALLLYLTIKPNLKKLKSLPVGIGVTVIITAVLISGIIHFIRFVPSPEAALPLSVVIASLLLVGGISAYLLVIRVIWSIWKGR